MEARGISTTLLTLGLLRSLTSLVMGDAVVSNHSVSGSGNHASRIWQNAIDRYYDELKKGGIKAPSIDKDLWNISSPEQLTQQVQSMVPTDAQLSGTWANIMKRLEPILLSLNDFAAVVAWALGMNGKVAAIIWGSIRLILKVPTTTVQCKNCLTFLTVRTTSPTRSS